MSQTYDSTDHCDIENKEFQIDKGMLGGSQKRRITLFRAGRYPNQGLIITLNCQWPSGMSGQYVPSHEHFLTIEVTAEGLKKQTKRFKVSFFPDPEQVPDQWHAPQTPSTKSKEPVFIVEDA